jgi:hypothetical protein
MLTALGWFDSISSVIDMAKGAVVSWKIEIYPRVGAGDAVVT